MSGPKKRSKIKIKYVKINSCYFRCEMNFPLSHFIMICQVFIPIFQLKKINSTCIIFEEKINFFKKMLFSNLLKVLTCRLKMDAIFELFPKEYVIKRYPCLYFMTPPCFNIPLPPLFLRPV